MSQGEIQSIVNAGHRGTIPPIPVANVNPTPSFGAPVAGLATQTVTYTVSAIDPSHVDQAAGFAYSIDWGDKSPIQSIAATAGNGSGVSSSHVYATAGTDTVTLTATDKDNGTGQISSAVTVLDVTSANLQTVINQQGSTRLPGRTDGHPGRRASRPPSTVYPQRPRRWTITLNLGRRHRV